MKAASERDLAAEKERVANDRADSEWLVLEAPWSDADDGDGGRLRLEEPRAMMMMVGLCPRGVRRRGLSLAMRREAQRPVSGHGREHEIMILPLQL